MLNYAVEVIEKIEYGLALKAILMAEKESWKLTMQIMMEAYFKQFEIGKIWEYFHWLSLAIIPIHQIFYFINGQEKIGGDCPPVQTRVLTHRSSLKTQSNHPKKLRCQVPWQKLCSWWASWFLNSKNKIQGQDYLQRKQLRGSGSKYWRKEKAQSQDCESSKERGNCRVLKRKKSARVKNSWSEYYKFEGRKKGIYNFNQKKLRTIRSKNIVILKKPHSKSIETWKGNKTKRSSLWTEK